MTPDEYRAERGLTSDHPVVAPSYAAQRSALAKASGLAARRRRKHRRRAHKQSGIQRLAPVADLDRRLPLFLPAENSASCRWAAEACLVRAL
ncbi:MucR family transcriptional regulator [Mesorhizobium sp. M0028]|uniref:MucR family transcriptional regulator n=1 Tax=unclassified Mesorhizobium TaxID=325217 RepID=UPI0033384592